MRYVPVEEGEFGDGLELYAPLNPQLSPLAQAKSQARRITPN